MTNFSIWLRFKNTKTMASNQATHIMNQIIYIPYHRRDGVDVDAHQLILIRLVHRLCCKKTEPYVFGLKCYLNGIECIIFISHEYECVQIKSNELKMDFMHFDRYSLIFIIIIIFGIVIFFSRAFTICCSSIPFASWSPKRMTVFKMKLNNTNVIDFHSFVRQTCLNTYR